MIDEATDDAKINRSVIFVLGMHRSGTSALSKMLSLLGCDLPKSLMPGTEANPGGYWESTEVMALNDAILYSGGSSWDDWLAFNSEWYNSPVFEAFVDRGSALIDQEFGPSPLFVLKDPRCARLVPFWVALFQRKKIKPLIIIPLRNPIEIANSLAHRNGFHPNVTNLLWLRHVLDAECDTRGADRAFSTYDQLLDNWLQVANLLQDRLGITWPGLTALSGTKVQDYIDTGNRHHNVPSDKLFSDTMITSWLRDTYAIMLRWADTGEDAADYKALDIIRRELNTAGPAFIGITQSLAQHNAQASEMRDMLESVARKDTQLADAQRLLVQAEEQAAIRLQELNDHLAHVESTLRQREEEILQTIAERDSAVQKARDIEAENCQIEALRKDAEKWVFRLAGDRQKSETLITELKQFIRSKDVEIKKISFELKNLEDRFKSLNDSAKVDERVEEIVALSTMLGQSQEKIKNLTEKLPGQDNVEKNTEVTLLSNLLAKQQKIVMKQSDQAEWLRAVIPIITRVPWWLKLAPENYKIKRNHDILLRKGLFNANSYTARYPDVVEDGIDPLKHYILHGMKEGRSAMG